MQTQEENHDLNFLSLVQLQAWEDMIGLALNFLFLFNNFALYNSDMFTSHCER